MNKKRIKPSSQHRRKVKWLEIKIKRDEMSQELRNSAGSVGTTADITKHSKELEQLIKPENEEQIFSINKVIEDPNAFALEKHLEDFRISNNFWVSVFLC